MKYVVMECHDGYAVLMDEGAGFVQAANLHYSVGQTVTDPLIMQESGPEQKKFTIRRILPAAAAAACLALASTAGIAYYTGKYKTHSVVVMSSDANIKMYLNKQGEVLSLQGEDEYAEEILKDYDGKLKSKIDVANDLLAKQIEEGRLNNDDTVDFYLSAKDAEFDSYKTEFETEIQQVKVTVQELGAPEPPKPVKPDLKKDEKIAPKEEPNAAPKADPKAEPSAPAPEQEPPKPAEAQNNTPPAAVKPNVKQGAKPNAVTPPAAPAVPAGPPTPKDLLITGKDPEAPAPAPAAPEAPDKEREKEKEIEKEEKLEPDKEPVKKPDEAEKPETEEKPDEVIPAPEKPAEQEGGKPALPDPDTEHAAQKSTEEKLPAEIHPVLPRPEPANGLLPKQEPAQISDPPELLVAVAVIV